MTGIKDKEDLVARGPSCGYFPNLNNIILVVSEKNVQQSQAFFQVMSINVLTGSCYLGIFVRYRTEEATQLGKKFIRWK